MLKELSPGPVDFRGGGGLQEGSPGAGDWEAGGVIGGKCEHRRREAEGWKVSSEIGWGGPFSL